MYVKQEYDLDSLCGLYYAAEDKSFETEQDDHSTDIDIKFEYPYQSAQFSFPDQKEEKQEEDYLVRTTDPLNLGDDDKPFPEPEPKTSSLRPAFLSTTTCHNLINAYVQTLGFESVANDHAKYCVNSNGRFMYINSCEFGVNRGKTKVGQIFYPDKKHWNELRKFANISDVIFIPVTYRPCHAWSVNGRKRNVEAKSNIKNWREHSGLLVRKGDKWEYYDAEFYTGVSFRKHYAYRAVTTSIKRKVDQALSQKSTSINAYKFSQKSGKQDPCTAPVLYVLEAMVKNLDINPYTSVTSISRYLDKVCNVLEEKGYNETRDYES